MPTLKSRTGLLALVAVASIVLLVVFIYSPKDAGGVPAAHYTPDELWPGPENVGMRIDVRDERAAAYEQAKAIVLDSMKAPATAVFPERDVALSHVEKGADYYTVESYVDAENSFGANIRTDFRFWMRRTGEGPDDWQVLESKMDSR
jgi:hypothetical protein